MPESLKALVVILGISVPIFILSRQPLIAAGYTESSFKRHRLLWFLVTLIAFFANSFWLYLVLTAAMLLIASASERAPLALYLTILFAVPHFTMLTPGIGPIESLFYINHLRLLNIILLLPLALILHKSQKGVTLPLRSPDLAVLGYLAIVVIMESLSESLTMTMRAAFYQLVDIGLPYYVASRAVTRLDTFRQIAAALVLTTVVLASIAIFETFSGWLLYESLRIPLKVPLEYSAYLTRSEGGPLRAIVSTTFPIILGYVLMIGIGMYTFLAREMQPRWRSHLAGLVLLGGLIASFSRGPWVGTAAMLLMLTVMGPGKSKRLTIIIGVGGLSLIGLLVSPFGSTVLDYLPFIGSVGAENIDYRQRLLETSLLVFWQNPVFGDINFLHNPILEQMRQGQGIIDIVNVYLQVALPYGVVGLFFFLAALLLPVRAAWKARKKILLQNAEAERLGRVLLAVMLGIGVIIGTASNIGAIAPLYWLMAGLCVSYARMVEAQPNTSI